MLLWTSLCASTPLQGVSKRSVSPWCRELEELLFLLLLGYGGVQKPAVSCKVRPLCSCVVFVGFLNYHSISSAAWFSDSCGGVGFFCQKNWDVSKTAKMKSNCRSNLWGEQVLLVSLYQQVDRKCSPREQMGMDMLPGIYLHPTGVTTWSLLLFIIIDFVSNDSGIAISCHCILKY